MASSNSTSTSSFSVQSLLGLVITLPIIIVIFVALGLAGASILENMHFARATDQILGILAAARDYAGREKGFNLQAGEDVLASLARTGVLTDVVKDAKASYVTIPWEGTVQVAATAPASIRMEIKLPARDCRHMALFLFKDATSLGLQAGEAHDDGSALWRRFFSADDEISNLDPRLVEGACGEGRQSMLALVFRLH